MLITTRETTYTNQDGKVVQDGEVVTLVECRPPARDRRETRIEAAE